MKKYKKIILAILSIIFLSILYLYVQSYIDREKRTEIIKLSEIYDSKVVFFDTENAQIEISFNSFREKIIEMIKEEETRVEKRKIDFKEEGLIWNEESEAHYLESSIAYKNFLSSIDEQSKSSNRINITKIQDSDQLLKNRKSFDGIMLNFIKSGNIRLFDKKHNEYVNTIKMRDFFSSGKGPMTGSGGIEFLIPKDNIIFFSIITIIS